MEKRSPPTSRRRPAARGRGQRRRRMHGTGELIVTFNYRYSPRNSALRQVIADGTIGNVTSVHFEWVLDTVHGADYFRRWHREKSASGGLLVHKSSHHFDLVNWWTGDPPSPCTHAARCGSTVTLTPRSAASATVPNAHTVPRDGRRPVRARPGRGRPASPPVPGGRRRKTAISVTETCSAPASPSRTTRPSSLPTDRGAFLTYSLNAHSPWEGYRVCVNGDAGRAELEVVERGHVRSVSDGGINGRPAADPMMPGENQETGNDVRPVSERLVVPASLGAAGVHGSHRRGPAARRRRRAPAQRGLPPRRGARSARPAGRLHRRAPQRGAGLAANKSIATGQVSQH